MFIIILPGRREKNVSPNLSTRAFSRDDDVSFNFEPGEKNFNFAKRTAAQKSQKLRKAKQVAKESESFHLSGSKHSFIFPEQTC